VTSPKGAARREQILQTTFSALATDGYRNTSLRGIGRLLDVEPAHILYYFDSREELLQSVVERWDAEAVSAFGREVDPGNALDFYVQTVRHNLEIPGIVHLYLTLAAEAVHPNHSSHGYFLERFRTARELLGDGIRFEQKTGRIGAALDPDLEARKLIALADGLQLQALIDASIDAPGDLARAIETLRGGAGVPAATMLAGGGDLP